MIEIVENAVQLALLVVCIAISGRNAARSRERADVILVMFFGTFALGDLYWLLYRVFYGETPQLFYVADLSWYAAYLFLYLLLQELSDPGERRVRHPVVLVFPAFAAVMCAFYMKWGDYLGNVMSAVLMTMLMVHAARGLLWLRSRPQAVGRRALYIVVLIFCAIEYGDWTTSCFWSGDTWRNPYFWFDCLLTLSFAFFLPAYRKAVPA